MIRMYRVVCFRGNHPQPSTHRGTPMAQTQGILERVFKLSEKGTTVKTEILAGLTTFVAVAYIIFVNPSILSDAGIPKEAAVAATVWSAVIGSAIISCF